MQFKRESKNKSIKFSFIISVEGSVTEKEYFRLINKIFKNVIIKIVPKNVGKSSPKAVLNAMKRYIKKNKEDNCEYWLVQDKDSWTEEQLVHFDEWKSEDERYNVVLSNPKFEYWLLLHYDKGNGISNSKECSDRLKKYYPNFNKHVEASMISKENILFAIKNAKIRYGNRLVCCCGQTEMHFLLDRICEEHEKFTQVDKV